MSFTSRNVRLSVTDVVSDEFPTGLRVLVVDDDTTCLTVLDLMLRRCLYQVTTCSQALVALKLLRERKGCFDMVLSDVHMPEMDGFTLLDHVGVEMDLPVIMMSADMSTSTVMKGIKHGACDYLIKPVRQEELKNMWQHVVRKKWNESREHEFSGVLEDDDKLKQGGIDGIENTLHANEECKVNNLSKKKKNSKEDDVDLESDDPSTSRKPRVVWSVELHQQFVAAVHQLGIDKAVPKKILDLMNVPGLTRENVASHLQKFRIYLKRLNGGRIRHSFGGHCEPIPDMYHFPMAMVGSSVQSFLQMPEVVESELTTTMEQPALLQPPLLQTSHSVDSFIPPSIRAWPPNTIHSASSTPGGVNGPNLHNDILIAMFQHQVPTITPEKTPIPHTPRLLPPPYPSSSISIIGRSDSESNGRPLFTGQMLDGYVQGASVSPFLYSSVDKKFPPVFSSYVVESEPIERGMHAWAHRCLSFTFLVTTIIITNRVYIGYVSPPLTHTNLGRQSPPSSAKPMNLNEVSADHHILHAHVHPISLEFEDVEYVVSMKQENRWWCTGTVSPGKDKQILNRITGMAYPGELLAMLGPSGSGKTSLLTALSGRRLLGKLSGKITYNGGPFSGKVRRQIGFVAQEDTLYPHLTVTETLFYTALLRLPTTLSRVEMAAQVQRVVAELGLVRCRDSLVGGRLVKGISGGERKRVSIGQEMLVNPSLLLLDEPTSGLDSTAAQRLLGTLKKLAYSGRTVVTTIHQPSSRLYSCFDKVLLLCEGSPIYYGPAIDATGYFDSIGFSSTVSVNPADFLLDLAHGIDPSESQGCEKNEKTGEEEIERRKKLIIAFREKIEILLKQQQDEEACKSFDIAGDAPIPITKKSWNEGGNYWSKSWGHQFLVLMERGVKERRFEALDKLRVFQVMSVALLGGLIWWRVPFSHIQDRVAMISFFSLFWSFYPLYNAVFTFPPERQMLMKETSSGMYHLSSYFMARNIGELPLEMALPVVFVVVVYWMGGLKPSLGCFLLTLLVLLLNVLVAQSLGMAIGAYLITNLKQATTLGSVISIIFTIAGGFYAQQIPPVIVWIKYLSYSFYCFRLLLGIQYWREETYECGKGLCLVADFPTIDSMGGLDHLWVDVGIMLFMFVFYRLLAYLALRWALASS